MLVLWLDADDASKRPGATDNQTRACSVGADKPGLRDSVKKMHVTSASLHFIASHRIVVSNNTVLLTVTVL